MKEVYLYQKLDDKKVRCQNCAHYCLINFGKRGICQVRENQDGVLYALNYGKVVAINIDPIEKKPLLHFLPGTKSLSFGTVACNFKCDNCQNWDISQRLREGGEIEGEEFLPERIIEIAKENNLPSISYTYNEPAIFSEYAFDVMEIARKENLKNIWVTNGFWSRELFDLISPYLNAANVDLKGFSDDFYNRYCGGKLKPVQDTLERLKRKNIWLEITTLIIPGINDSEETLKNIAEYIKNELGDETPWHVARFFGNVSWKMRRTPDTPIEILNRAQEIGKAAGLKYVYIGNV
ncbi:MAG: AmmeMemoRadiSam system radical SAM enzyme [Candidatus Pacebacteria bacterium]|nr:AmmeMemoRadiSam system radical SAM enzyme [Candidatus Paceibacterota bacterium]